MQITDLSNNPINRVQDAVRADSSNVRTIRINAIEAGFTLKCDVSVPDVDVEGRAVGDVSWVDLETTGIDLDPYVGTSQDFEVRYSADDVYGGDPVSDANPLQSRMFNLELERG